MKALMPPQATAAIAAAKGLAAAAKRGLPTLRHFWSKIHGPGKKRLAEALAKDAPSDEASDVGAPNVNYSMPKRRKRGGKRGRGQMPALRSPQRDGGGAEISAHHHV